MKRFPVHEYVCAGNFLYVEIEKKGGRFWREARRRILRKPYFGENVAAKLGVNAERIYRAFTEKSDILNSYIVPEYEVLHTQSREYIVDDLLEVMKERGVEV